jgi:hypothetical protein
MTGWTRAIVRLDGGNRVVTKGYRKGVYERVTNGISGESGGWAGFASIDENQDSGADLAGGFGKGTASAALPRFNEHAGFSP